MYKYIVFSIALIFSFNSYASDKFEYEKYWVQYSEKNSLFFRHLTSDLKKNCPSIIVDDKKIKTTERKHNLQKDFPVKICQTEIDNKIVHNIKYKDLNISTKQNHFQKISVVGDAGCITDKNIEQKCNLLSEYPFPEIARNIAKNKPDMIVHVGDYFYSKSKCQKTKECIGRSYGDNLETWKVDFLNNAEVFLKNTPILFIRGNHEKCTRGGNGWSVIFDYSENFRKCSTYTPSYNVEFDKLRFLVVDSAEAEDYVANLNRRSDRQELLDSYIQQFNNLAQFVKSDKENILIIHRPVLSKEIRPWDKENKIHDINYTLNYAIQNSEFKKVFPMVKFILSGHTHTGMFLKLKHKNHQLYQIVSGNGGAFLNKTEMIGKAKKIFNYKIKDSYQYQGFGFTELLINDDKINEVKFYDYKNHIKFAKNIR